MTMSADSGEYDDYGIEFCRDHGINYNALVNFYTFGKKPEDIGQPWPDYIWLQKIDGVDYYAPNNEDWGSVVAVDHKAKLAINTHFYEMDDMASPNSDYAFIAVGRNLLPRFEA